MNYIPVAGTGGYRARWVEDDSEFTRMMLAAGHHSLRVGDRAFRWNGALDGIDDEHSTWETFADALFYFSRGFAYEDLNFILHSHAGNIGLILAARGFKMRTVTTIGTPCRQDIPLATAENHIGFHQHIYDTKLDWWGWLGQFGEGFDLHKSRSYNDPRVQNIAVNGISHSKILTDRQHIAKWMTEGWLQNIRHGAAHV